jgi:DNA-binding CsgD family transcriptional regulator
LRALLKQREGDKAELEEKVVANVKELVLPYVQKLKKGRLDANTMAYLRVLESNLNSIISPFAHSLSSRFSNLTPKEIQIANLIKEGKTTRELADLFRCSDRTIESHRQNIRTKVGISNKKVNLRSYLMSL